MEGFVLDREVKMKKLDKSQDQLQIQAQVNLQE